MVTYYLLFMVMEDLSRMSSAKVGGGFMMGFSTRDTRLDILNISHLLFADDILIFYDASQNQIQSIRALFCSKALQNYWSMVQL